MKKGLINSNLIYKTLAYVAGTAILVALISLPTNQKIEIAKSSFFSFQDTKKVALGDFPVVVPTYKYGFVLESYLSYESKVTSNQTLGSILSEAGVPFPAIQKLVNNCKGVFNVKSSFRVDKPYMLLHDKKDNTPLYFVFQPNVYEFFVFDLQGDLQVRRELKPISVQEQIVTGVITSSLWQTLTSQGISFEAAAKMEDALQWSVDFSHTQNGDQFKMIYDQEFIDGQEVGVGQVYAAVYNREGKNSYAIWFEQGEYKGFYDLEGRAITANFLKAPVKYTRISSKFNRRRFHPILKRVRPHLGTDYAAPYGTPIYAVGNGVITEAAFTNGNGRYIKIKHDEVYQTQYLHMSKFAKGMKKGTQVAQGEVIGYVGSSGLATGPHVCFRFWKNGRQVNHLQENLPAPKPLPADILPSYFEVRDKILTKLGEFENTNENTSNPSDSTQTSGHVL